MASRPDADAAPAGGAATVFVLLRYGLDADRYRAAYAAGEVPDESPYGFHLARDRGWRVLFSVDRAEGRLRSVARRALRRLLGFDLIHAWDNRDRLHEADIAWTMTEWEWLALRCLGRLAPSLRRPVIGNSVWLFNDWKGKGRVRQAMVRWLAMGPGLLTVHSDRCLPVAHAALPDVPVRRLHFGVTLDERDVSPPFTADAPVRILAMGTDWTRDWGTFLAAFGNDDRFEIELVCAEVENATRSHYANLRPREGTAALSRAEMRRLYEWSDVVVVPMVENLFSGITSAIDGCGYGRPVISTRTGGVPTYFDEGEVAYVPSGDVFALRDAALAPPERLLSVARAGHARFLRSDYSSAGMVGRYATLSREVLGDR